MVKETWVVTYDMFLKDLDILVGKIYEQSYFTKVSGVPRGGLVPAVVISHKLKLPFISLEDGINLPFSLRKDILVLDDICDSGQTLGRLSTLGFPTAAVYYKQTAGFSPTFVGVEVPDNMWVVFPWEHPFDPKERDFTF